MTFPKWASLSRLNKAQKASARLRYMINRIACEHSPRSSILEVAKTVGIDYSTICTYIAKGAFSPKLADKLEAAFGPDLASSAALQDPLSIK